jgi:hypothetical protein
MAGHGRVQSASMGADEAQAYAVALYAKFLNDDRSTSVFPTLNRKDPAQLRTMHSDPGMEPPQCSQGSSPIDSRSRTPKLCLGLRSRLSDLSLLP